MTREKIEFLVSRRKSLGLTQGFMSGRLGVSRALFGRWEGGDSLPDVDQFESWCLELGFEMKLMLK